MERKLILITNDDGVSAQGIQVLTDLMLPFGDVMVVAPDSARSGAACSISPILPISVDLVRDEHTPEGHSLQVYACSGTPMDCVKVAIDQLAPRKPDLVVSGINHGDNASCSIHYSGTMGAALGGCMKGVPSIGYSLRTHSHQCDFSPYTQVIIDIARYVLVNGLPQDVCLNVNFPEVPRLAGVRVCRQARGDWRQEWEKASSPRGGNFYWLAGYFVNLEPDSEDTDYWALDHGYAAVTPITVDMTDHSALSALPADFGSTLND